jgi:leucyl-tRNA synthetase
MEYNPQSFESLWQKYWEENHIYKVEIDKNKPKFYVLDMFPYPSGAGLHVGHPLGYIATDIMARYKRMKGFNVLHPMGFDSFGLPAEQYAIETGQHPAVTTQENIKTFKAQLAKIGFCYDWNREVQTSDPNYYKWTQWIFQQLFSSWYNNQTDKAEPIETLMAEFEKNGNQKIDAPCDEDTPLFSAEDWKAFAEKQQYEILLKYRLTYLADSIVNWCPALGTVLANDEIKDGLSERGGHPVERKKMRQWMMRITAYSEKLLKGLEEIEWSEALKDMQSNWIGKSYGAEMKFYLPLTPSKGGGNATQDNANIEGGGNATANIEEGDIQNNKLNTLVVDDSPSFGGGRGEVLSSLVVEDLPLTPSKGGNATKDNANQITGDVKTDFEKKELPRYFTTTPERWKILIQFAKENRKNPTNAEKIFWELVRNKRIGYKFRRQHPIEDFIVDFVCLEKGVVVEIDGGIHNTPEMKEYDEIRTKYLEEAGFKVIRFTNQEVQGNIEGVEKKLLDVLNNLPLTPSKGGGNATQDNANQIMGEITVKDNANIEGGGNATQDNVNIEGGGNNATQDNVNIEGGDIQNNKLNSIVVDDSPSFGGGRGEVLCFTTRPDTIFGVTFIVMAPEHELVPLLTTPQQKQAVDEYVAIAKNRSERERQAEKKVSGIFTGSYAINPITKEEVPIWVADYVLAGYGTGVVMAVPGGDERDFRFAKHFNLPIIPVVSQTKVNENGEVLEANASKEDKMINSGFLNGMTCKEAAQAVIEKAQKEGLGKGKVNYRLRDAVFSRQRYWGEPVPVYFKDGLPYLVDEADLPLTLPSITEYKPTTEGEPPLARAENWTYSPPAPKGGVSISPPSEDGGLLEQTTMPGWAGSSWYFLRYMDAQNDKAFCSKEASDYWNQVDLYVGGTEHAVGHLLYSRFWTHFLHDRGFIGYKEPFKKLINQGMIQGNSALIYRIKGTEVFVSSNLKDELQGCIDSNNVVKFRGLLINATGVDVFTSDMESISAIYSSEMIEVGEGEAGVAEDSELMPLHGEKLSNLKIPNIKFTASYTHIDFLSKDAKNILNIDELKEKEKTRLGLRNPVFAKENNGHFYCARQVEKMSKSKYNVENPDEVVADYSADALRLFEMFLGPLEQSKPWNTQGIDGSYKFLKKLWRLFHNEEGSFEVSDAEPEKAEWKVLHQTIKKVEEDIERYSFNTPVSNFMICVNELGSLKCNKVKILEPLVRLIAPYCPHVSEELWHRLGNEKSVHLADFPVWDNQYLVENDFLYPVMINGKKRTEITFPLDISQDEIQKQVLENEIVQKWLEGKTPKVFKVVPQKIITIAV